MWGVSFINRHGNMIFATIAFIGVMFFRLIITFNFYPKKIVEGTIVEKLGSSFLDRNQENHRIVIKKQPMKS